MTKSVLETPGAAGASPLTAGRPGIRRRSGALRISRAVAIDRGLSMSDYGLRDRIWLDLRLTPGSVKIGKRTFNLKPGQAVISMAGYAAEFACHRRLVAAGLARLVAAGWFKADVSRGGTVVTCLQDPRDGSDLDNRAKGGGWRTGDAPDACPPVAQESCPPVAQDHIDDAVCTPRSSAPLDNNNGPRAAVLSHGFCKNSARASVGPPLAAAEPLPEAAPAAESASPAAGAPPLPGPGAVPEPEPPPGGPGGGRPAPRRPVREASPPPGSAPEPALAAVGPLALGASGRPPGRSAGRPLDLRADLVPFGPPRLLAGAALAAGLTPGEAAREILAGCPVKIALAWLLCIARKRRRLRCPGAVFRAGCRTGGEPSLADLVDADRLLRGAAGELLPRGSMPAHSAARVIVGLAVTWAANAAVGPAAWRVRRAELEAAAAAERQAQLRRLRLALPRLSGAERARAERVLAAVA